ncbi:MAG: hypothetical protein U0793_17995 [Gemmataceae bacterium]
MATPFQRVQDAWATGDPLALHHEVEQLAAEGHPRQTLEDALEALLLAVRAAGASDDTEEIINGVWDRLTGWCHADRQIETRPSEKNGAGLGAPVDGKVPDTLPTSGTQQLAP